MTASSAGPWVGFPAEEWGVVVTMGPVPTRLADATRTTGSLQMAPGRFLATVPGVGRMLVTAEQVTVEPETGRDSDSLDFLLYGLAPRWIRILRSQFSLHASAACYRDGALAIMGFSGAGKSTTVAELTRRGFDLLIDDVVPVDVEEERAWVHGWSRPVHLNDDAAERLGIDAPTRVRNPWVTKAAADLPSRRGRWPLNLAIELVPDDSAERVTVVPLRAAAKLQAILTHAGASGFSAADGRAAAFFAWATRVAQTVDVLRISRPAGGWHLESVVDAIIDAVDSPDVAGSEET